MPEIGEVRYGKEIGKSGRGKYLWGVCIDCGKERWTKIGNERCGSCSRRGERCASWKGGRMI